MLRTLIILAFDFYLLLGFVRLLCQVAGVEINNPIFKFVNTITEPLLKPFRRFNLSYKGFDVLLIISLLVIDLLKYIIILSLWGISIRINPLGLPLIVIADLLGQLCNIFFYAIIVVVVMSWINPQVNNPFMNLLHKVTDLILIPVRSRIPLVSGIDLSPLVVLIVLKVITIVIIDPIMMHGLNLSIGFTI